MTSTAIYAGTLGFTDDGPTAEDVDAGRVAYAEAHGWELVGIVEQRRRRLVADDGRELASCGRRGQSRS
jgi:hypothetical protein